MSKLQRDLTTGSVAKQLIMFSLPFLASTILQAIYNVADMVIVGMWVGDTGVAGVNIGGQVTFFMTIVANGLSVAGTVLIGQYLGAKRMEDVKETIGTLLTVLIIAAVVITVGMLFLSDPILHLLNTPKDSYPQARAYLDVTVLGIIFIFGYNALSAVMRGMGDSKNPLFFIFVACVLNIALDLLMVGFFGWQAMGAAVATVISQAVSMILCILYLIRHKFVFDFAPRSFRIRKVKLMQLLRIGVPSSAQNLIVNMSFLIIGAMVNSLGTASSAAVGIVGKFNSFGIMPAVAMSSSVSAMAAQNIGAGRNDRALETLKNGAMIGFGMGMLVFLIAQIFPAPIVRMFQASEEAVELGVQYMRTFSFDYLFVGVAFCLNGLFVGAGHTTFPMINAMFGSVLVRAPLAYVFGFAMNMGLMGIGLGAPIATFVSMLAGLVYLRTGRWKVSKALSGAEGELLG